MTCATCNLYLFRKPLRADNVDGVWGHECKRWSISFVVDDAVVLSVWVCEWCSMYGDWLERRNDSFSQVLASRTVVCRKQKKPAAWSGSLWAHQKHRVQRWWVVNYTEWIVHVLCWIPCVSLCRDIVISSVGRQVGYTLVFATYF